METPKRVVCPMCKGEKCSFCEDTRGELDGRYALKLMNNKGVPNSELQAMLTEYYKKTGSTVFEVARVLNIDKNALYQFSVCQLPTPRSGSCILLPVERIVLWDFLARWQGRPFFEEREKKREEEKTESKENAVVDNKVRSCWFG